MILFVLGLLCVASAIGLGAYLALAEGPRVVRLSRDQLPDRSTLSSLATRASAAADRTLERSGRRAALDVMIEDAGLQLRSGEAVVAAASAAFIALVVVGALLTPIAGVILAVIVLIVAYLALGILRDRRRAAFASQLNDLLQMLAGSLRAGHALLQSVEGAASELESPSGDELRRVMTEVRLGRDLADALDRMAERMHSGDFGWVVQAVRIHREVGGDLADLLDRVAETIRAREHLRRQVSALSAEGRVSAIVLFVLPFALTLIMTLTSPSYIGLLFTTSTGLVMLGVGLVLMTFGGLWLRRVVRLVY
jgi:tight adherence protein B